MNSPFEKCLADIKPDYELPDDDIVSNVFVPALEHANEISIASGYFSSGALAKIAPGLASALSSQARVRILLSPNLEDEDLAAFERGVRSPEAVLTEAIDRILVNGAISPTALEEHAAECISYLIAASRLEFRFVLMPQGMYHKKLWLISAGGSTLAVHGSGNATVGGMFVNGEQMAIERDWADGPRAAERVGRFKDRFERDWSGQHPGRLTLPADAAVEMLLRHARRDGQMPTVDDFWRAWTQDSQSGLEPPLPIAVTAAPRRLRVPDSLDWQNGRYAHQGAAVSTFIDNDGRGVLAIATGGGKTKTSLIAATQIQNQSPAKPFLLMILVPSDPLVRQWDGEVKYFGLAPTIIGDSHAAARRGVLDDIEAAFHGGTDTTQVVLATRQLFHSDKRLRQLVERCSQLGTTMLIADEVHNFGVRTFIDDPPEAFQYRLGLSATPVRQYDLDGTNDLFDYFGEQIFEFTLQQAIEAKCLVPYDYFIHRVELTDDEIDRYRDLSQELASAGFRIDDDGRVLVSNPKIERLLRRRRAVLEQAENKISALRAALLDTEVKRALIYCSPKELELATDRQIEQVNRLLSELGIVSHELTSAQTSSDRAAAILERFADGRYQALTAMKVLDEGVDVPATEAAFILASTTVEREWVQRRGRVLRTAPGKTVASVHDFVVLPTSDDDAAKSVLRGELRRLREFAKLAKNKWDVGGPMDEIGSIENLARGRNP